MIAAAAVVLTVAAGSARETSPARRLSDELLASATATAVLERRCAALGLTGAPSVRARVMRGASAALPPSNRLDLRPGEAVAYRQVQLMCGDIVLSEATNWYVPGRLTAQMNAALQDGDLPFGRVILPLAPSRRTLRVWVAQPGRVGAGGDIVRHRALVLDVGGRPLAEVVEHYKRVLID